MPFPYFGNDPQTGGGLLDRLMGPQQSYGGLLDPAMQKQNQNEYLMSIGASLLANSRNGQGFGANVGQSLLQANEQKRQSINQQIQSMLIAAQVKKAGQTDKGDLAAIIDPVTGKPKYVAASEAAGQQPYNMSSVASDPASLQEYSKYVSQETAAGKTPVGFLEFEGLLAKNRVGAQYSQGEQAGAKGAFDHTTGGFSPATTLPQEAGAAGAIAGAQQEAKTTAEKTATAAFDLPKLEQNIKTSIDAIEKLRGNPGLRYITGVYSKAPVIPGTSQAEAAALADQVQGRTFLEAYETLKGAGQVTEVEGHKGEQAIARLQRAQSTKSYQLALDDLKSVLQTGLERVRKYGGQNSTAGANRVRVDAAGNVVK